MRNYRPFASANHTSDWCLVVEVGSEDYRLGRYATEAEAVAAKRAIIPGHIDDSGYGMFEILAPGEEAAPCFAAAERGEIADADVGIDLVAMHRLREERRPMRHWLWREEERAQPGRILRLREAREIIPGYEDDWGEPPATEADRAIAATAEEESRMRREERRRPLPLP